MILKKIITFANSVSKEDAERKTVKLVTGHNSLKA